MSAERADCWGANQESLFSHELLVRSWLSDDGLNHFSREISYIHSQTSYSSEMADLTKNQNEPDSTFSQLENYYKAFQTAHANLEAALIDWQAGRPNQHASQALAYLVRFNAALANKVCLALWLKDGRKNNKQEYTEQALKLIDKEIKTDTRINPSLYYFGLLAEGEHFANTDMGVRITAMHSVAQMQEAYPGKDLTAYGSKSDTLLHLALSASVKGLTSLNTYLKKLAAGRIEYQLIPTGLTEQQIEAWRPAA